MDAVMGLALLLFAPGWPLLVKRNLPDSEQRHLKARYPFLDFSDKAHQHQDCPRTPSTRSERLAECGSSATFRQNARDHRGPDHGESSPQVPSQRSVRKQRRKTPVAMKRGVSSRSRNAPSSQPRRGRELAKLSAIQRKTGAAPSAPLHRHPSFQVYPQLRALREKRPPIRILRKGS